MKTGNDPRVIAGLRDLHFDRRSSVDMLRYLDAQGLNTVQMMDCFREAFDLGWDDVTPIGGWFADGTGELDDERVGLLLDIALSNREHAETRAGDAG